MTFSSELALTLAVLQAAQPASFDEEPSEKSKVSQGSCRWAAPGLLNPILTGLTQLLPGILGYRYLRFLEPSFLLPSNLLSGYLLQGKQTIISFYCIYAALSQ